MHDITAAFRCPRMPFGSHSRGQQPWRCRSSTRHASAGTDPYVAGPPGRPCRHGGRAHGRIRDARQRRPVHPAGTDRRALRRHGDERTATDMTRSLVTFAAIAGDHLPRDQQSIQAAQVSDIGELQDHRRRDGRMAVRKRTLSAGAGVLRASITDRRLQMRRSWVRSALVLLPDGIRSVL